MARYNLHRMTYLGVLTLAAAIGLAATKADTSATKPAVPPKIVVTDDVVLAFFQKHEPDVYQQMMILKERDKDMYVGLMKDFYKEVGRLLDLQSTNPPLFEITMEDRRVGFKSLQLARSIQSGKLTGADLAKANDELADLLSRQFDLRQQIRQLALDEQRARLEEIQKTYDTLMNQFQDRQKSKDDLIKQRFSDLMKKNPKVEW